jgi:tetratricopeptide (TPR) repeat protein
MLPENQLLSKPQPVHKEKQQIEEKVIPDIPQSMPSNIQPKYGGPTRPLPIIHAEISQNANQLIQKFRELEKELNNALITEDLDKSKRVYAIMKEIFSKFPDEFYDVKTDLFSDILSANFRVHQLEEAMNEMEKRELDRILIDQERQEEIIEEKKKIRIEKEKIKEEIEKVQEDISSIDLKNRIVTHSKDDIIIEEKDVDKLKELARLERWKHDRNKLEREPHVKEENRHFLPKPTLKHHIRHIEQNETRSEINEKIIKQLYQKGLINLYSNNKDEAKDYFNRILEINPFHKPSIIRLEQLT